MLKGYSTDYWGQTIMVTYTETIDDYYWNLYVNNHYIGRYYEKDQAVQGGKENIIKRFKTDRQ